MLRIAQSPSLALLLAATVCASGLAESQTIVPNTFDTDSYLFVGTNNTFSPEVTVGVDLTAQDINHFNFAVIEFADLSAVGLAGDKRLRFEVEAYALTEIIDGFPVTTPSLEGDITLKIIALDVPYSDYLAASDKRDWYDTHIGGASADATVSFDGLGLFEADVTPLVSDWLSGQQVNYGFALVGTSGDPVEFGANEGGNGAVLVYTPSPADLDSDGDVDDADFGLAFAAFTGPGSGPPANASADLDGDNDVDDADFGLAFAAFSGPAAVSAVPEPGALGLFGAGSLLLLRRRRH